MRHKRNKACSGKTAAADETKQLTTDETCENRANKTKRKNIWKLQQPSR